MAENALTGEDLVLESRWGCFQSTIPQLDDPGDDSVDALICRSRKVQGTHASLHEIDAE